MSTLSQPRTPGSLACLYLVARGVVIETIRRKEFYVLLIFMAMYVIGVGTAALVGVENQQTMMFLLNLGIGFAYMAAHLMAALTAARQIPFEMENRTLYPLLAKPISRANYLLGKWLASAVIGAIVFAVLFLMSWIPWLLFPNKPELEGLLLIQALALNLISVGLISALALLLSLIVPQGVNLALLALHFFVGSTVLNFISLRFTGLGLESVARWILAYIPNFQNLNLFNRYTDTVGAVSSAEFLGLFVCGLLAIGTSLVLMELIFRRRPL